jgi:predicted nucleic acid-binding protein
VIAIDTSVLVRYVVGSPADEARAASTLIEAGEEIGISPVALVECAHVLRTQYAVPQAAVIDALIAFVQRENVRILGGRTDIVVGMLVRARTLAGRPIPDALILAAAMGADAAALATFDRGQARYGFPVVMPSGGGGQ